MGVAAQGVPAIAPIKKEKKLVNAKALAKAKKWVVPPKAQLVDFFRKD